jgi:hypothetical protein
VMQLCEMRLARRRFTAEARIVREIGAPHDPQIRREDAGTR